MSSAYLILLMLYHFILIPIVSSKIFIIFSLYRQKKVWRQYTSVSCTSLGWFSLAYFIINIYNSVLLPINVFMSLWSLPWIWSFFRQLKISIFIMSMHLLILRVCVKLTWTKINIPVLRRAPYSPDMAPCEMWLLPMLKKTIKDVRFESRGDIKQDATILQSQ